MRSFLSLSREVPRTGEGAESRRRIAVSPTTWSGSDGEVGGRGGGMNGTLRYSPEILTPPPFANPHPPFSHGTIPI